MWISIPVTEQEVGWIEKLGGPWRFSKEELYRRSGAEVALVTPSTWDKWELPLPPGPILSFTVPDIMVVEAILNEGASWLQPLEKKKWGVHAGFLHFPSGLIVEVVVKATAEPIPYG